MENKRLTRRNGMIAGVCGGIAAYFGWDATVIRILWFLLLCLYSTGFWVYLICWIVMPKEDKA